MSSEVPANDNDDNHLGETVVNIEPDEKPSLERLARLKWGMTADVAITSLPAPPPQA